MELTTSKYRILETNVLLERFVTYNEVFAEYFKTMKVIERGEALRYETYARLQENYLSNIHKFIKLCNSYITKYQLENSLIAEKLNQYFLDLIDGISCLDTDQNQINHPKLEEAKQKIKQRQVDFIHTIGFLTK
ncbi:hypothetical protein [Companilactobacillus halodurans]|uniref:Uncharacterized protein n=1 Tax=Companilactobacillus halodurans TaxID=2584183 RepID=A0A5P0ZPA8_9LACO|nr:hypothetical protein [Companilactobacillus halodurans]MQS76084.1 hypothetical protein [Companilactobacillus halodurans]MQS96520.1 hypothetical protein [Companilactobacillus halodurans]